MKKRILILMFALSIALILHPFRGIVMAQDDPVADLEACEELIEEAGNTISDLEIRLIEAEVKVKNTKTNDGDGDISLADILELIPSFRKLTAKQRSLIITIGLGAVALGLSYIPPPTE